MRRGHGIDGNQKASVEWLEMHGWTFFDTAGVGGGFPDGILCKWGRVVFVEFKNGALSPSRRKLRPSQTKFHARLKQAGADVAIVETAEDLAQFGRPW